MTPRVAFIILITLLFIGCSRQVSGDTWTILSPQETGDWTPTPTQVLAGREAAKRHLQVLQANPTTTNYRRREIEHILSHWEFYRLQACGRTTLNQHRIIYLNFLVPNLGEGDRWKADALIQVRDGGADYWQAEYDPSSGNIVEWDSNGYA